MMMKWSKCAISAGIWLRSVIDQQVIGEAVGVAVAEDAALRIQHKAIVAGAFGQTLDVVGEHAIEPAHAVRAADGDLAAIAEIEGSCAFDEGGQLLGQDAEDGEAEGSGEFLERTGSDAGAPPRACARAVGALTGAAWSASGELGTVVADVSCIAEAFRKL